MPEPDFSFLLCEMSKYAQLICDLNKKTAYVGVLYNADKDILQYSTGLFDSDDIARTYLKDKLESDSEHKRENGWSGIIRKVTFETVETVE